MTAGTLGGLAGKARRTHRRERADRAFADFLIEDYLEPEDTLSSADRAPICGRREFMPTLTVEAHMADEARKPQLELPWDERRDDLARRDDAGKRRVVWSTDDKDLETKREVSSSRGACTPVPLDDAQDAGVLRVSRQSKVRMPLTWAREPETRTTSRMSLRGFGVGCAIGGVAAALVLAVLRVAIG